MQHLNVKNLRPTDTRSGKFCLKELNLCVGVARQSGIPD